MTGGSEKSKIESLLPQVRETQEMHPTQSVKPAVWQCTWKQQGCGGKGWRVSGTPAGGPVGKGALHTGNRRCKAYEEEEALEGQVRTLDFIPGKMEATGEIRAGDRQNLTCS